MKSIAIILVFSGLFCIIAAVQTESDGVEIESEFGDEESTSEHLNRLKRNTDNFLKKYIDKLKNGQEIVLSSGTGFSGAERFKTGDIHIKKENSFKKSPEVTESARPKYSYPFGLGTFLMSGCFRYSNSGRKNSQEILNSNDYDNNDDDDLSGDRRRKKRAVVSKRNGTVDMESFCARYSRLEEAIECQRIIPGAYTLGTGFDIKFENNENSRRKSVVTRYCNHKKAFDGHSVPDIMTANGIYDTKTQTMTFGESSDYMRFVASKSNLDRYSNIFKSDTKSAYGGVEGQHLGPENEKLDEDSLKENTKDKKAAKTEKGSDFYLYQIQSTILIYDLILDQINAWQLDIEFLIDFLFLPESYFYYNAPAKFEKFILRYGTHVVVSAKFGGEFKIMNTMRKSKATSIESFAEKATQDSMKMFSRTITEKANVLVMNHELTKSKSDQKDSNKHSDKNGKDAKAQTNEYFSSYISVKGGSQEVAAIVANLGQPDFSDSFTGWLDSVYKYPRAFDFKYESIVSILDIDARTLFAQVALQEERICSETLHKSCYFGFTLEDFVDKWEKKRRALQFAITIYLKEPQGLTLNKFFIQKGNSDCRFNILNYLPPYWTEIVSGKQEFHITFNFNEDEPASDSDQTNSSSSNKFLFVRTDEVYFIKRDEFWLAKRKGTTYTYESARILTEPFKSAVASRNLLNILGLVLEYNEADATVSVVDLRKTIAEYATSVGCSFGLEDLADLQSLVTVECGRLLKTLRVNLKNVRNLNRFWSDLKGKVIGVVDYVDPIKSVIRAWDLKFAVLPCQLKWSNNLMMVLPKTSKDEGKCLKFTASTEGELFLVIATTPSNQNSWYIFQITTKGVIFYREGLPLLLNEDSAAGTTGNKNIYQNFFVCLNYEERKLATGGTTRGLFIQYGIQISSNEISHLYLSYFDTKPLDPIYYSFGSRNADVQILNAHLDNFNVDEQIKLRCSLTSTLSKATLTNTCDYKCHRLCDGCTQPYSVYACKQCSVAKMMFNATENFLCVEKCAQGYESDLSNGKVCVDTDECVSGLHECQKNAKCVNTVGSYRCECLDGFEGNGIFCEDIDECALETHSCSSKAACVNLPGNFECKCSAGFTNHSSVCIDIDECALDTHNCSWNRICHNTIGSYKCLCPTGFQDSTQADFACTEIDECATYNHTCPVANSHCQNTYGSYECLCLPGFTMHNNACQDINECHNPLVNNCDPDTQRCLNTDGSFFCECNEGLVSYLHNGLVYCADLKQANAGMDQCADGFYSEGENCVDLNECHLNTHDCDSGSACVNTEGGFYCQCSEGFQLDEFESGKRCLDVNECEVGSYECSLPDMVCVNTHGSYYCQCEALIYEAESSAGGRKCLSEEESTGINVSCQLVEKLVVCNCDAGFARRSQERLDEKIK